MTEIVAMIVASLWCGILGGLAIYAFIEYLRAKS
jgi:hypothetical protein|tara:strand:+ start:284 stop:385 length:102 start_codon:yes stop_codon:yes gene_type:complete